MNSFINVQVRILAQQAQAQLAALNGRLAALERSGQRAGRGASMFGGALNGIALDSFGSRVQWAGRQLEYNFTIPILAAGGAAMKMALDHETAMTRVKKVYGDATHDATFYRAEIQALERSFETLSNAYGVNQTEVLNVAAGWAAAGASGVALAKSVDLTMQTMILGEMDAAEATQALISIQAQYGFSVDELTKTIATLNMVENQTGISLEGLVQGFERSAGVARATGVDVRHLAAMLASLVPATGSAAQAGNALKTIFSRLISPTKETVEVLDLMGISVTDMSWKSATMTDRLVTMAKKFEGLSSSQKGVVSSVAASRWQVNKFEVLMRDLLNTNGYYQRALQATSKETDVFNQMQKELNAVLTSNPRRLQVIWTMLQNAAADIIQPMIPLILWLAQGIQKLVTAFSHLPQPVQLVVLGLLTFLAVVGPLVRIGGAMLLMTAELGKAFFFFLGPIRAVTGALGGLLRVPVMAFLNSMGFLARGGVVAMFALVGGARAAMAGLSATLVAGSRYAGMAFYAGLSRMTVIATGIWFTLTTIFMAGLRGLQAVILVGARAIGVIWRAALMGIAGIQAAWAVVMSISWARMFTLMAGIATGGFTAIAGLFTRFVGLLRAFSGAAVLALTGPWGMAITAVIVLVLAFWDELKAIWTAVVRGTINAFNSLPRGIHAAMMAVVNIVIAAAMAVYRAFSYLNPWAHHSPSLVENVTTGMNEVGRQFARAKGFTDVFRSAYKDLQRFGQALARLKAGSDASEYADMRKNIKGIDPAALASFDRLVRILPRLKALLASLKPALDAQVAVVAAWKAKLDAANEALDKQAKKLDALQKIADKYQTALTAAQGELDRYTSAPIEGMKEMSDAIFENEMQQKKLRLELMRMEEAVGPMDQLQSKIQAINGQIEMLKGEQTDLRNAGAGSEILSQYDDQIKLLEDQQDAINEQIKPMQDLADAIDELGRKGEQLDLENSLKFDPLQKQIDDVANAMKELPFDEIMAGVIKNKAEVDRLTEAYNNAKAAVDKQQGIVDMYTNQRDAIQARYDTENNALQKLQEQYDKYEAQIRDIESALKDAGSAADTLTQARKKAKEGGAGGGSMSPGAENFKAGAGGNFPDPGGFADIGREGGLGDQSKLIDDFTKEMAKKTAKMFGMFNFLDPIKKAWNTAWGWLKTNVGPAFGSIGDSIKNSMGKIDLFPGSGSWLTTIKDIGNTIKNAFGVVWDLIGPEVISGAKNAWNGLKDAFKDIQPEIEKFRDLVGPIGDLISMIWKTSKPGLLALLAIIGAIVKGLLRGLGGAIGPVIRMIGDLVAGLIKIIRGIIEFIVGVFTGDWKMAWQGIVDIFSGITQGIMGVLKGLWGAVWGFLKGFISGFIGFFTGLYDTLVGHSIIPDMINAIVAWIISLPGKAWNALASFASKMGQRATEAMSKLWNMAKNGWNSVWAWLKSLPGKAAEAILSMVAKFGERGRQAMDKLRTMASAAWSAVNSYFRGRPQAAADAIRNIVSALGEKGRDAMNSLKTGLSSKWNDVKNWASGIGGRIKSAIGNISLASIGRAIFNSLFDGMKAAWENSKAWLSKKGQEIKDLKGPIEKDRKLLVPEGKAIFEGLGNGMMRNWSGLEGWLAGVSTQIQDTMRASQALDRALLYGTSATLNKGRAETLNNRQGGSTTVNNFYGNLEFPNVSNGDDAEEFLANLESIVRGR
jgi:TP901 family phage tail tape measure protein